MKTSRRDFIAALKEEARSDGLTNRDEYVELLERLFYDADEARIYEERVTRRIEKARAEAEAEAQAQAQAQAEAEAQADAHSSARSLSIQSARELLASRVVIRPAELAALTGMSRAQIYSKIYKGEIPSTKSLGGRAIPVEWVREQLGTIHWEKGGAK